MEQFSEKLDKWILLKEQHPNCNRLWKHGDDFWYDKSKDKFIHKSFVFPLGISLVEGVDDYISKINTWKKNIAIKNNQEKKLLKRIDSWD